MNQSITCLFINHNKFLQPGYKYFLKISLFSLIRFHQKFALNNQTAKNMWMKLNYFNQSITSNLFNNYNKLFRQGKSIFFKILIDLSLSIRNLLSIKQLKQRFPHFNCMRPCIRKQLAWWLLFSRSGGYARSIFLIHFIISLKWAQYSRYLDVFKKRNWGILTFDLIYTHFSDRRHQFNLFLL